MKHVLFTLLTCAALFGFTTKAAVSAPGKVSVTSAVCTVRPPITVLPATPCAALVAASIWSSRFLLFSCCLP